MKWLILTLMALASTGCADFRVVWLNTQHKNEMSHPCIDPNVVCIKE